MQELIGTGVALVTPFNAQGAVDHDALTKVVQHQIENGIDYLVVLGTTGESVTLTKKEKQEVIHTIKIANSDRLPMVIGVGGNDTAVVVNELKTSDLSGFTAILSVSPSYNKPTQEGIYQHFKAVSEASPLPVILYNVPGRTSKNMEPSTTIRLATDFSNIIAVKEAGNDMGQYLSILRDKPSNFHVISGDDDLALPVALAGGSGVISVIGQALPTEFSEMIRQGISGNAKDAFKTHFDLMTITSLIFSENNPAGIKAVLESLQITDPYVRLPLVEASGILKNEIKKELQRLGKR